MSTIVWPTTTSTHLMWPGLLKRLDTPTINYVYTYIFNNINTQFFVSYICINYYYIEPVEYLFRVQLILCAQRFFNIKIRFKKKTFQ